MEERSDNDGNKQLFIERAKPEQGDTKHPFKESQNLPSEPSRTKVLDPMLMHWFGRNDMHYAAASKFPNDGTESYCLCNKKIKFRYHIRAELLKGKQVNIVVGSNCFESFNVEKRDFADYLDTEWKGTVIIRD